jgi:hypothetical protein
MNIIVFPTVEYRSMYQKGFKIPQDKQFPQSETEV